MRRCPSCCQLYSSIDPMYEHSSLEWAYLRSNKLYYTMHDLDRPPTCKTRDVHDKDHYNICSVVTVGAYIYMI